MLNEESIVDVRKLLTGKDGQLFVTGRDNKQIFLAEVDEYVAQLSMNNTDYQPVGSALVFGVNTGYSLALTFTEAVIRDDVLLERLIVELQRGFIPIFDFQGKLRRFDDEEHRQVFRNCMPDGSVDLLNVKPGEIIKRPWSFRVNAKPELLKALRYTA